MELLLQRAAALIELGKRGNAALGVEGCFGSLLSTAWQKPFLKAFLRLPGGYLKKSMVSGAVPVCCWFVWAESGRAGGVAAQVRRAGPLGPLGALGARTAPGGRAPAWAASRYAAGEPQG